MSDTTTSDVRLYGDWRKARGVGFGDLSMAATLGLGVAILAPIMAVSFNAKLGLGLVPFSMLTGLVDRKSVV